MPCNSSHMAPSQHEEESVRVINILRETGHKRPKPGCYGNIDAVHYDTAVLCAFFRRRHDGADQYSLEAQIWWRDHKAADAKKERARRRKKKKEAIRKRALSKLTAKERKALGV